HIWSEAGSPLLVNLKRQGAALQAQLQERTGTAIPVAVGMRYGTPSLREAMRQLNQAGVRRLLVLPLYPQYSATTSRRSTA
ncbi:MAG TPA: ferrochelatase, partial [Accumulibacter sp.]|uniref:ferrochelatase n=1 Tax=Accumulibacter sp. TaxID=2053492 RepID=UPI002BD1F6E0